jgi:hypothetical protein
MRLGSWPHLVKRGGLEVLPRAPVYERRGKTALLLRGSLSMFLMEVPTLPTSPHDRDGPSYIIVTDIPETAVVICDMMRHRSHRLKTFR